VLDATALIACDDIKDARNEKESAVSVALIVTRSGKAIALSEWMRLVEEDDDLRLRVEPYVAINPRTGDKISMKAGEADAEYRLNGQWIPFLRFRRGGDLTTKYVQGFDDPKNPTRLKIASVARRLGALVKTDASDEILSW
jgi:hypothetical protein